MEIALLRLFQSCRNAVWTVFFGAFSLLGETIVFSLLVLLLFLTLPRAQAWRILVSVLLSLALNALLKRLVLRPRPYLTGEIFKLDPPFSAPLDANTSFPSGHVQLVSTLFFCLVFPKGRPLLLLLVPVAVALARMYFGIHYPTDVIWGLFLGFCVAFMVSALFPERLFRRRKRQNT